MTSAQSPNKPRRSILPSLKFGSASSARHMPASVSASSTAEPDYFGNFNDNSSSLSSNNVAATPAADSHPWTKLVGDGGIKTALPDLSKFNHASTTSLPLQTANTSKVINSSNLSLPSTLKKPATKSDQDFSRYKGLDVDGLAKALAPSPSQSATRDDVLVLDIRPSTSFGSARVTSSINICAPSTLLKRPAITVERIEAEMLPSAKDKKRFMRWRKGPLKPKADVTAPSESMEGINKIVVLDTDTCRIDGAGNATAGGGGPCLIGMLKKFEAAGFDGELCWLVGGFNRLAHSGKANHLIDTSKPSKEQASSDDSSPQYGKATKPRSVTLSSITPGKDNLKLPPMLVQPRGLSLEAFQTQSTVAGWPGQAQAQAKDAAQSKADSKQRPNGTRKVTGSACANPFFDNIRQNRELQHGITERIPMELPPLAASQIEALPPFLQQLVRASDSDRAQMLAQSFFDVEKAEQNRLLATMSQHSAASEQRPQSNEKLAQIMSAKRVDQSQSFPFSIAAALERGADNRYNNIWTYEHSRVRLNQPQSAQDPGSDYLNASHVEPAAQLDSNRRYIASQAPLPTTFEAFWTAIWEQNCRVVVMLTREHESGRLQSHPYWLENGYGPNIRIDKLEETVLDQNGRAMPPEECVGVTKSATESGQLFPSMVVDESLDGSSKRTPTTVRRIFRLRNLAEPSADVRRIVHLQYVAWPDYHIPDSPDSLLGFMNMADASQHAADTELRQLERRGSSQAHQWSEPVAGPMVVHCSAGVGRTGAFIAIDIALDVIRRCRRRAQGRSPLAPWDSDLSSSGDAATETPEVDMLASSEPVHSRTRSDRRSLKRDLSPAAMDIDSGSESRSRDGFGSPGRMSRHRSSGGSDTDLSVSRLGADPASWSSNSSGGTSTPPTTSNHSLQLPDKSTRGSFSNPFSSTTFNFSPAAGGIGGRLGAGSPMRSSAQSHTLDNQHQSPSRNTASSRPAISETWRQTSSPYSEVSTPSLHGSARSSFSSAAGFGLSHQQLSGLSPGPSVSSRNVDGALAQMHSFDLAPQTPMSSSSATEDQSMNYGDTTVTGSNEATPFDSTSSKAFNFHQDAAHDEDEGIVTVSAAAQISSSSYPNLPHSTNLPPLSSVADEAATNADTAYEKGEDIIRKIVETAREQRMSLIQTGRQYVFVYSAVLAGILTELSKGQGTH